MTKLNQAINQLKKAIENESDFELDAAVSLLERHCIELNQVVDKILNDESIKDDALETYMSDGECLDELLEVLNATK